MTYGGFDHLGGLEIMAAGLQRCLPFVLFANGGVTSIKEYRVYE